MSDRRAEARRRTLQSGATCRSFEHARLHCPGHERAWGTAPLPDVTLQLKAASSFKRQARIAWRRIEHCGVEFTEPESDAKAEQPHAAGQQMAPDRSNSRS